MSELPYLDIHTYGRLPYEGSIGVANLSQLQLINEQTSSDYATAGIHPWWLEEVDPAELKKLQNHLENLLHSGRLWGVGETGLDRGYPEFFEQQKELFKWHWKLAETYSLPLIIHSVRSGSDFLEMLNKKKSVVPWIFHDFRGNETLVKDLLRLHPQTYFSFGISLDNSPQIRELLPIIPIENIFLETDNQKHLDIHEIYLRGAEQLQVDMNFLKSQIWHNFQKVRPFKQ